MSAPRSVVLCAVTVLAALGAAAPAGAASKPISGTPRIVELEPFLADTDDGLVVGAVMVTRYPKVVPKRFPQKIRALLKIKARGVLRVVDGGRTIAQARDQGGLPIAIQGQAVSFAHLLLFSPAESERILDALVAAEGRGARIARGPGTMQTVATATEQVTSDSKPVAEATTTSTQAMQITDEQVPKPPLVINGCVLRPGTWCYGTYDLTFQELPGIDLSGATLNTVRFTASNLKGANFRKANLIRTQFGCYTPPGSGRCSTGGADLTGADFTDARLMQAQLTRATMPDAKFAGANLSEADLQFAGLARADFTRAGGQRMNFARADLSNADFTGADLSKPNFTEANFTGAKLPRANLREARVDGANFSGANLAGASFGGEINDVNFAGANLTGVSFALTRSNLDDYDAVNGSNFAGANLTGANFRGVSIRQANFSGAIFKDTICPYGNSVSSPETCPSVNPPPSSGGAKGRSSR